MVRIRVRSVCAVFISFLLFGQNTVYAENEIRSEENGHTPSQQVHSAQFELAQANSNAEIVAGTQSQFEVEPLPEPVEFDEGEDDQTPDGRYFPENVRLILSESAESRLVLNDIESLPAWVELAVWPDSALVNSGRPYYLLTPPVDIMESYRLKHIVKDEEGYYVKAFDKSLGLFARNFEALAVADDFTRLIYSRLAAKQKSIMLLSSYVDPKLNRALDETQIDFNRVDYRLDPNHASASVKRQWQVIENQSLRGAELIVYYELDASGIAPLESALADYQ